MTWREGQEEKENFCNKKLKSPQGNTLKNFLTLFNNDVNKFIRLKQFGKLFEVEHEQINRLFHNNVDKFVRLQ